jgi:hypothetical protein
MDCYHSVDMAQQLREWWSGMSVGSGLGRARPHVQKERGGDGRVKLTLEVDSCSFSAMVPLVYTKDATGAFRPDVRHTAIDTVEELITNVTGEKELRSCGTQYPGCGCRRQKEQGAGREIESCVAEAPPPSVKVALKIGGHEVAEEGRIPTSDEDGHCKHDLHKAVHDVAQKALNRYFEERFGAGEKSPR